MNAKLWADLEWCEKECLAGQPKITLTRDKLLDVVAEIRRLRNALEPFAGMYEKHKYSNDGCLCPAYVSMPQVRAAAEALNPGSTENEHSGLHKFGFGNALADAGKGGGE